MRSTTQLSITLPNEMAEMVKSKVESGEYASESEVIRDGLRAMHGRRKTSFWRSSFRERRHLRRRSPLATLTRLWGNARASAPFPSEGCSGTTCGPG